MPFRFSRTSLVSSLALAILSVIGPVAAASAENVVLPPLDKPNYFSVLPANCEYFDEHVKNQPLVSKPAGAKPAGSKASGRGTPIQVSASTPLMLFYGDVFNNPAPLLRTLPPASFKCLILNCTTLQDADMAILTRFKNLKRLELRNTDITDKGLAKLAPLTELECLILSHTKIDGTALANLATLKQLKRLDMASLDLVPASLASLKQFDKLRALLISQCHLRNPDLRLVGLCPNISYLDVSDDPLISDKGMIEIKPLKKLTFLNLTGTVVTTKGILSLQGIPLERIKVRTKDLGATAKSDISKAFPGINILNDDSLDESLKVYKEMFQ